MASQTAILKLWDLATGESSAGPFTNWGEVTDFNLQRLEAAVGEVVSKTLAAIDVALSEVEETALLIKLDGTLGANVNVTTSGRKGFWFVRNATAGAFSVTFKPTAGTGVIIPQGQSKIIVCDGTNSLDMSSPALPTGATDNAMVRADGALGLIQSSPVIMTDAGVMTGGAWNGTVGATTPASVAGTTGTFSGTLGVTGIITATTINAAGAVNASTLTAAGATISGVITAGAFALSGTTNLQDTGSNAWRVIVNSAETSRITTTGILVGLTVSSSSGTGVTIFADGLVQASRTNNIVGQYNRSNDGTVFQFGSAGSFEGNVSISGATCTYGAFFGSHDSQLADGSRMYIPRGSICDSIDMLCTYLGLFYIDHDGIEHRNEEVPVGAKLGDVVEYSYEREVMEEIEVDETVHEIVTTEREVLEPVLDATEGTRTVFDVVDGKAIPRNEACSYLAPVFDEYPIVLADGEEIVGGIHRVQRMKIVKVPESRIERRTVKATRQVGKMITETVNAEVIELRNDQLPRFKISDTAGSTGVYGVFAWWDEDYKIGNDAHIGSLGAYVVRIKAGVEIKKDDLIEQSDVPGCGWPQKSDAFLRSTVAKITIGLPVALYADGSQAYPCTLHCG